MPERFRRTTIVSGLGACMLAAPAIVTAGARPLWSASLRAILSDPARIAKIEIDHVNDQVESFVPITPDRVPDSDVDAKIVTDARRIRSALTALRSERPVATTEKTDNRWRASFFDARGHELLTLTIGRNGLGSIDGHLAKFESGRFLSWMYAQVPPDPIPT